MTALDNALEQLDDATRALAQAHEAREVAMRRRDAALRSARDAGATYVMLQERTGMSSVTVTKALRRE